MARRKTEELLVKEDSKRLQSQLSELTDKMNVIKLSVSRAIPRCMILILKSRQETE